MREGEGKGGGEARGGVRKKSKDYKCLKCITSTDKNYIEIFTC